MIQFFLIGLKTSIVFMLISDTIKFLPTTESRIYKWITLSKCQQMTFNLPVFSHHNLHYMVLQRYVCTCVYIINHRWLSNNNTVYRAGLYQENDDNKKLISTITTYHNLLIINFVHSSKPLKCSLVYRNLCSNVAFTDTT